MIRVTVLGRPGCHLCDQALEMLIEFRDRENLGFELVEIDVGSDDDLLRRFLERIPVIQVDGEIVSELIPDRTVLRARLDNVET